jgi:hypothetical protein
MKPHATGTPTLSRASRWRPGSSLSRAAFALATLITMVMLFAPSSDVPIGPEGSDKLVHAAMFAALLLLGWYARIPLRFLAPILVAYGGIAEIIQGQIGRDEDFWDWVSDSTGIVLAVLLVWYVRSRSRSTG